jgi:hypothetical protein
MTEVVTISASKVLNQPRRGENECERHCEFIFCVYALNFLVKLYIKSFELIFKEIEIQSIIVVKLEETGCEKGTALLFLN